jgi:glycosyltransferase involved in cell wall biosynthesis
MALSATRPAHPGVRDADPPAPRRVLLCIPTLFGGGAERHAAYLAAGLDRAGWEVTLATLASGPNAAWLHGTGVRLEVIPARSNYDPAIVSGLVRLIRRVRPLAVQAWMPMMNVAAGIAARWARTPFSGGEQCCAHLPRLSWKPRLEAAVLARAAQAVVANSRGGADYVERRLGPRMPVTLVNSALPLAAVAAAPPRPRALDGIEADAELLLFVGRFDAQKNLPALFEAMARVVEARPRAVAVACGDGPDRAAWAAWVRRRGLERRILLPGYVDDAWGRMKSADVFVFPSLFEGQPNAVVEAMACGCPLVVSDIPAHRAFLDERTARLVPPRDAAALARAVADALDHPAGAMARAARARALSSRYGDGEMVRQYERVFLDLSRQAA